MSKNIVNKNTIGDYHGYQEWYSDRLFYRCIYKNGDQIGYEEWHNAKQTNFYIR